MEARTRLRPVKGQDSRLSDLTIMIVGKVGKFRSFKISSRMFLFACLFLAIYIGTSIFVFNRYFHELRMNRDSTGRLEQVQDEIKVVKKDLHKSKQHLVILKKTIHDLKALREGPPKPAIKKAEPPKSRSILPEKKPHEKAGHAPAEMEEEIEVEIRDLVFGKKEKTLTVSFNLVNMNDEGRPASGYVHMIAMNKDSVPPRVWPYPRSDLQNGAPVDYKRGQLFFIKRFKVIRGVYLLKSQDVSPSSMKVLIYNRSGSLVIQKEFKVKKALP